MIGELGEAIAAVDVFADSPVLMAKALAGGISLESAGEALSIGAAGLFLRSLGGRSARITRHSGALRTGVWWRAVSRNFKNPATRSFMHEPAPISRV